MYNEPNNMFCSSLLASPSASSVWALPIPHQAFRQQAFPGNLPTSRIPHAPLLEVARGRLVHLFLTALKCQFGHSSFSRISTESESRIIGPTVIPMAHTLKARLGNNPFKKMVAISMRALKATALPVASWSTPSRAQKTFSQ